MERPTPLEIPATLRRSRRFLWRASILLAFVMAVAAGSVAWYVLSKPCEVDAVKEASSLLVNQMGRYDAVYQVATNGSGDALVYPVAVLKEIRMDTNEVAVPACLRRAKSELLRTMDAVIQAFQASMALEPDETVRDLLRQSRKHLDKFIGELEAVNECAPFCIPRLLD